jgi:hypothetical protein
MGPLYIPVFTDRGNSNLLNSKPIEETFVRISLLDPNGSENKFPVEISRGSPLMEHPRKRV